MREKNAKIEHFTDLIAWQKGHQLVLRVYNLLNAFPVKERFGLRSQMSRAVVSVTSNIAEGFGRHSFKEKARFYRMSKGSLLELENQILISKDLDYLPEHDFHDCRSAIRECQRLVQGLINKTKELIDR